MAVTLDKAPCRVVVTPGNTTAQETTLEVHCRDRVFQDVSVFDVTNKREIFRVTGNGIMSWSFRRALMDANGEHILDFRHYDISAKNRWTIESPEGKQMATMEHVNQVTKSHSNVNAVFFSAHNGDDINVEMRQLDRAALTTVLMIQGTTVAEINLIKENDIIFNQARGKERSVWNVRVAADMDLTLVRYSSQFH